MKKILSTLLVVLLLASLCATAFADEWQEVYEENGFTLTFTDEFRNENLKGIFNHRPSGMIDDGLYYASFIYYAMSEEELNMIAEKGEDEISEADRELISSKVGTLAVVYGIDYTKISEENLAIQESIADMVTEIATAGDVVFYRYNLEDAEETLTYLSGIAPAYQEEYRTLQAAFNEVLKNAEYYTPVIRGEELVGTVISFETTDLDGNPVRSEDIFKDHEVTMVNLWATWCHNCINEMTELGEMAERLAEKNVAVVGICQDADEELDTCREILKEHNVTYLNLMPFDDLDEIFGWNGSLPTSYFFDSEGTLLCQGFRGAPQTMDPYEEIINGFLSGEAVEVDEPDTPHTAANNEGVYRVIVSDTDGDLVKGATVQFCSDTTCMMGKTDENGVAVFQMEEGQNYTVHILKVPEGYVKNPGEYLTDNTYCDIYIPLEKAD
jgi:thiol-disulfide isomerase/thioredoxin